MPLINPKLKTSWYNIQCLNQLGLHIRIELDGIHVFWMIKLSCLCFWNKKLSCLYLNAPWLSSHVSGIMWGRSITKVIYSTILFKWLKTHIARTHKMYNTIMCWNVQAKQHQQSATLWKTPIVLEYFLVVSNASKCFFKTFKWWIHSTIFIIF